jgi:hypothetical protein
MRGDGVASWNGDHHARGKASVRGIRVFRCTS